LYSRFNSSTPSLGSLPYDLPSALSQPKSTPTAMDVLNSLSALKSSMSQLNISDQGGPPPLYGINSLDDSYGGLSMPYTSEPTTSAQPDIFNLNAPPGRNGGIDIMYDGAGASASQYQGTASSSEGDMYQNAEPPTPVPMQPLHQQWWQPWHDQTPQPPQQFSSSPSDSYGMSPPSSGYTPPGQGGYTTSLNANRVPPGTSALFCF
jgi:hypothetical protein